MAMEWIKASDKLPEIIEFGVDWLSEKFYEAKLIAQPPVEKPVPVPVWFVIEEHNVHSLITGKGKNKQAREVTYRRRYIDKGFFDGESFVTVSFPPSYYKIESDFNSFNHKNTVVYWMPREIPPTPLLPEDGFTPYGVDDFIKELKANAEPTKK